jgi:hypothetical protein
LTLQADLFNTIYAFQIPLLPEDQPNETEVERFGMWRKNKPFSRELQNKMISAERPYNSEIQLISADKRSFPRVQRRRNKVDINE